ncbi:uncharacterized protein LOC110913625 [Helianthus annuus]|uniref:uncharacterized protein LOC110913625 n=1 Tax=Helianthus annuus TaxID=4232 RepID=UPI000B90542B|nr:uncharacterized protein LOC110913625 [Helianthus annuus]
MDKIFEKENLALNQNLIVENGVCKWRNASDSLFSVKQVREDLEKARLNLSGIEPKLNWNSWAPPKGNFLLWRAVIDRVASREGLAKRGVPLVDVNCPRCGLHVETSNHIFLSCLWARSIWWNVLAWVRIRFPADCSSLADLLNYVKESPGSRVWKRIVNMVCISTVLRIWSARNAKVFDDCFIPIMKTVDLVKEDSYLWICNRSKWKKPKWENWMMFDVVELM